MLSCRNASTLISLAMERPLSRRERLSLRVHMLICGSCRRTARQLRRMREVIRNSPDGVNLATGSATVPPMPEDTRTRLDRRTDGGPDDVPPDQPGG